jgi:sugar O-acyltransferase (sialic acid O-acetyltransferase NeuD family)
MSRVVIYGNGRMASLAHFYLTHDSPHEVVAFSVDRAFIDALTMHQLPLVPLDELAARYPASDAHAFVAMGYRNLNRDRAERCDELSRMGYRLISYVSSKATTWSDLDIGGNCFVMEGNIIQPFVSIGNNVVLGPANSIGHHAVIGDDCFIASRADLSGHVTIGARSFVGANSTLRNGVVVASDNVIGAGAVIMADTADRAVYAAPRARLMPLPSNKLPRI